MGCSPHADPDGQRVLDRPWIHALAGQLGPELTGPGDVLVSAHVQQEVQLFGKQRVIVLQVVAEEREGLNRRAAPDDHFDRPG